MKSIFKNLVIPVFVFLLIQPGNCQQKEPPNVSAKVSFSNNELKIEYDNRIIFKGTVKNAPEKHRYHTNIDNREGLINQVITFTIMDYNETLEISGEITGSEESFPCEVDRKTEGLDIVRHSFGLSSSLLNRAVYDRERDWVLSIDYYCNVLIKPEKQEVNSNKFNVTAKGKEIIFRFRPRYYQKHRGLKYFEPWTYKVWKKPVVGWCSWFAYFTEITEENVKHTADVISEVLAPYGYEYLQIDDGYQRGLGLPELWLKPNDKFPNGLKNLAQYIKSRGLKPGIWTNVAFRQDDYAEKHKEMFVLDKNGNPAVGNWVHLSMDGSNPATLNTLIRPVYKTLKEMGWEYYKVDALRHLRYEGYNSNTDYFKRKNTDRVTAFRNIVKAIRDETGREHFMMGCWGIRPELIGIIDGCRIGTDGYSFAGLSQYNSFNNVVWLNDPDHIELSETEAYRSTMVTSLTGSLFLLTDKPEKYLTGIAKPAKQAAPVLFTLPGQIYDIDPSRLEQLNRVDSEVSGSGTRVFDAGRTPKCHLYLLEIYKDYENWMLLGRTGGSFDYIPFSELGLSSEKEYFVFEYWLNRLLGSYTGGFTPGKIDPKYNCQLFCIRERKNHPQVIATDRHITCGGFDLTNLKWENNKISGKSKVVAGDPYSIYLTESEGYRFKEFVSNDCKIIKNEKQGIMRIISILSEKSNNVEWSAVFEKLN